MFETLLAKDRELLVFLNNLGSEQWDSFWLLITNQFSWTPLFLFIFYLTIKTFGWKQGGFLILAFAVLVAFSDQFTNLIKDHFARLRPNNDPRINASLRTLIRPQSFSFISGHATTSTFFAVFTMLLFRDAYKYIYLLVLFPLVFGYSRIYLGVHFPLDILCGYGTGVALAFGYYALISKLQARLFR